MKTKTTRPKSQFKKSIPVFFPVSTFHWIAGETATAAKKRILSNITIQHNQLSKDTLKTILGTATRYYYPLNAAETLEKQTIKSADFKSLALLAKYNANSSKSLVILWRILAAGAGKTHSIKLETIAKDCHLSTIQEVRDTLYKQSIINLTLESDRIRINGYSNPGTYKPDGSPLGNSKIFVLKRAQAEAAKLAAQYNSASDCNLIAIKKQPPKQPLKNRPFHQPMKQPKQEVYFMKSLTPYEYNERIRNTPPPASEKKERCPEDAAAALFALAFKTIETAKPNNDPPRFIQSTPLPVRASAGGFSSLADIFQKVSNG